jgi:ATP-dependent Clp protease ATP-binding subunit ClpB
MDLQKFTERARGFLQAAQTIALREGHQRIVPEHLAKALLDDPEGMASTLIRQAGGDAKLAKQGIDAAVARIARVSGGDGQIYLDTSTARVIGEAESLAKKAGDSFVTAERLLVALVLTTGTEPAKAFKAAGLDAQRLDAAIADMRKGRTADSASAEEGYDALKKYARDLTEAAREGKLDPVIGRD